MKGRPRDGVSETRMVGGLPRRDLVLLPLVSLLTILALLVVGEGVSRLVLPEEERDACVLPDRVLGSHAKPNCTSITKAPEGPWVTSHYNDCGFRSPNSCQPLPPGLSRVAVIGSSTSEGYMVPAQNVFTTVAAKRLAALCGTPVDFQNLGTGGLSQDQVVARMDQALAVKPAVLIWVLVPFDIENVPLDPPALAAPRPTILGQLRQLATESRAVLVAQHYLYRNIGLYTNIYLGQPDRSDFLRTPIPPRWRQRIDYFESNVATVAEKAQASNVRFFVVLAPQQAQAALAERGAAPQGVDPLALGRALKAMVERHGAGFLDDTTAFGATPWRDDLFYPVDGHLASAGNHILGEDIAALLADSGLPAFASCSTRRSGPEADNKGR